MKVLFACEVSGVCRDAAQKYFKDNHLTGYEAWSCDLLPSETRGFHYQGDVLGILNEGWDVMVAFPPCTHLAVSGARWFKDKKTEQEQALRFVKVLMDAPINKIAIENPIGIISSRIRKPDQIIQPWQFGHPTTKATCLWLKNLPKLKPTNVVMPLFNDCHKMPPSEHRAKDRGRTYQGIADAIVSQWLLS